MIGVIDLALWIVFVLMQAHDAGQNLALSGNIVSPGYGYLNRHILCRSVLEDPLTFVFAVPQCIIRESVVVTGCMVVHILVHWLLRFLQPTSTSTFTIKLGGSTFYATVTLLVATFLHGFYYSFAPPYQNLEILHVFLLSDLVYRHLKK